MQKNAYWWVVVPILLLVVWLGARELDHNPFWGDERHSILVTRGESSSPRDIADVLRYFYEEDQRQVPGYYVLLGMWGRAAGWSPLAQRVPSLLFGLVAIAAVYRLACDLGGRRAALFATLILATSALFLHQLTKMRMYVPLVCVVALMVLLYFRLVRTRRPHAGIWLGYFGTIVFGLYVHYMAGIPLVALGIYHLAFVPRNRRWWQVVAVTVAGLACFAPWVPALMGGIGVEAETEHFPLTMPGLLARIAEVFGNGSALLFVLGLAAVFLARGRMVWRVLLLAVVGVAVLAALHAATDVIRWARIRYFMPLWPFLVLLFALALSRLQQRGGAWRWLAPLLVAAWAGLGLFNHAGRLFSMQVDTFSYVFPLHQVERLAGSLIQGEDIVMLFVPDDMEAQDYAASRFVANRLEEARPGRYEVTTTEFYVGQAEEERRVRLETVDGYSRVWLASAQGDAPAGLPDFESALRERYVQCPSTLDSSGVHLQQYATDEVCCLSAEMPSPQIQYANGVALVNSSTRVVNDDQLRVATLWRLPPDAPLHALSVTLQAFGPDDERVGQFDTGLLPQAYTCSVSTFPAELDTGDYRLMTGVYYWQTGERVTGEQTQTGETGEMLPLSVVSIGASE